jgi:hypothetical protein
MPGISSKYFRIRRRALSVCGMTSASYAPGAFRRPAAALLPAGDGNDRRHVVDIVMAERAAIPQEATR